MFERYTSLQTLYLPNFDISSLTDMDYVFNGYSSLKYIDISNIKDSKNLLKFAVSELNSKESLTVCQNDRNQLKSNNQNIEPILHLKNFLSL